MFEFTDARSSSSDTASTFHTSASDYPSNYIESDNEEVGTFVEEGVLATNSVDIALAGRVPEAVDGDTSLHSGTSSSSSDESQEFVHSASSFRSSSSEQFNDLGTSPINNISTISGELTGTALNEVSASTQLSNGQ